MTLLLPKGAVRLCMLMSFAVFVLAGAQAKTLHVQSVPPGYTSRSVELGLPFSGAVAQDPSNENRIFVSVGSFGSQSILAVNLETLTTATVASGFGNVGGMAVLANGDLAVTENFFLSTILRAHDANGDGDFLDTGEVSELIAPILVDSYFTGSQVALAPAGNASGIPAGALLVQTADGQTSSEVLLVDGPCGSPVYRPAGGAFFSGFEYNGGMAFDPAGNLILGASGYMSGRILALVNANADERIDAQEAHVLVDPSKLTLGIADLAVSKENRLFFGENSGTLKYVDLPADLASNSASPAGFAQTDAVYLSTVRLAFPERSFAPAAATYTTRLYLGGYVAPFDQTTNLVVIEPAAPKAGVAEWECYR